MATEQKLARFDAITSAVNARYFQEILTLEVARSQRHSRPLAMAYVDLDNFKIVNDQMGHAEGDRVLKTVVHTIQQRLRREDTVARLGGDEFAILFPETPPQAARFLIQCLQSQLLAAMAHNQWPVTFSIG